MAALTSLTIPELLKTELVQLVGDKPPMVPVVHRDLVQAEDQEDQDEVEALLLAENTELDDYLTDWLTLPGGDLSEVTGGENLFD